MGNHKRDDDDDELEGWMGLDWTMGIISRISCTLARWLGGSGGSRYRTGQKKYITSNISSAVTRSSRTTCTSSLHVPEEYRSQRLLLLLVMILDDQNRNDNHVIDTIA